MPAKREKPLHIPLSFGDAVRGLLKVDPKQLPASAKRRTMKKKASKPTQAMKKA